VCIVVLHSTQDHLRTGTRNLDYPISCLCKKTPVDGMPGRGICSVLSFDTVPMVPSSPFITATGGECSPCEGFSLDETICFESLEFVTSQFSSLSLSPLRDGSGAIIMGPALGEPRLL
jgi:hypothetical protein